MLIISIISAAITAANQTPIVVTSISPEGWAIIVAAAVATLGMFVSVVKWLINPRIKETIVDTMKVYIGPQLEKIPELITAVDKLTNSLERQYTKTEQLSIAMIGINERLQVNSINIQSLEKRVIILEDMVIAIQKAAELAGKTAQVTALAVKEIVDILHSKIPPKISFEKKKGGGGFKVIK